MRLHRQFVSYCPHPVLANEIGRAGRQRLAEMFTLDKMVRETSEVYRHLLLESIRS